MLWLSPDRSHSSRFPRIVGSAGKRPGRPARAGPAINVLEDPNIVRPRVNVFVENVGNAEALVDSGAYRTVASGELVYNNGLYGSRDRAAPLRALGGHIVPTSGRVDLNVCYQERVAQLREVPVVAEAGHALILGQDWIAVVGEVRISHQNSGFRVDVGQRGEDVGEVIRKVMRDVLEEVSVKPEERVAEEAASFDAESPDDETSEEARGVVEEFPFAGLDPPQFERNSRKELRVFSRQIVQPESMSFVEMEVSGLSDGPTIVPRAAGVVRRKEWVIPSSLVDVSDGRALVPFVNLSSRALEFRAGQRLSRVVENCALEIPEVMVCDPSQSKPVIQINNDEKSELLNRVRLGADLSVEQQRRLADVLSKHVASFPTDTRRYGATAAAVHRIQTVPGEPIRMAPRRCPPAAREEIQRQVQEMVDAGVAERSFSPWAAPVVLVRRKDERTRFCVDYRKLNDVTVKDAYPSRA